MVPGKGHFHGGSLSGNVSSMLEPEKESKQCKWMGLRGLCVGVSSRCRVPGIQGRGHSVEKWA